MEQVTQQAVAPKKKKKGLIIALVIGAVVIIGGGIAIAMLFINTLSGPSNVAKTFISDVSSGKQHQAYDSTAKLFQDSTPEDVFNTFVGRYQILTSLASFSVDGIEVKSVNGKNIANASMTLKGKDGSSQELIVTLLNESGKWKVATVTFTPVAKTPTKTK